MKRTSPRKLELRKDTLRSLSRAHLEGAAGGAPTLTCTCNLVTAFKACGGTLSQASNCIGCEQDPKTIGNTRGC